MGKGIPKTDQRAVLDTIAKKWTDAGYPPVLSNLPVINGVAVTRLKYAPSSDAPEDGLYVELQVTTSTSTVDSRARCIPGNVGDINRGDDGK